MFYIKLIITGLALSMTLTTSLFAFDKIHGSHGAIKKLNYDSLFSLAVPLDESAAANEALEKCIDAYGGQKKLQALQSMQIKYRSAIVMARDTIEITKYYQPDRRYKIIRDNITGREVRILNGQKSWFIGRDTVMALYSGRYKAELFSYLTLSMPLAAVTEPFSEIRYGTRDNDSLGYYYMKKNDSVLIIIGIDPEDNMIKSSEGIIYQDTTSFIFVNKLSDYRSVDGYRFPFYLVNISMGLEVARSVVTSLEINPQFSPSIFLPSGASTKESNR